MLDIFQALTWFRSGKYAILGDIKKMFWQIKLNEYDQKYHGVIWDQHIKNEILKNHTSFSDIEINMNSKAAFLHTNEKV